MAVSNTDLLALARQLPIPVPWNRDVFIENLASQRGRRIQLLPTDTSGFTESPCGVWLIRDDDDLILHEAESSDYHIDQIVCHEIGHMVLGHGRSTQSASNTDDPESQLCLKMLPDLDPTAVRKVLRRKLFVDDQERDAERFAHILMLASAEAAAARSAIRSVFFRAR